MVTVRVEPAGIELDVLPGETVMAAAVRDGYRWPTVCGGLAECGTCVLAVVAPPPGGLARPGPLEAGRLAAVPERRFAPDEEWRLACQLRVGAPGLVVRKRGVRRGT
jgi:ferredoxin, 2Fe-2S